MASQDPVQMLPERFAKWHDDCTIKDEYKVASNYHVWTDERTCYGHLQIPSNKKYVVTWKLKLLGIAKNNVGCVCIGISSFSQTETLFYHNKQLPNYGYETSGDMYSLGFVTINKERYSSLTHVTMELNTTLGLLRFYKHHRQSDEKLLQHSLSIVRDPKLIYRLAVCIKDATVGIIGCDIINKSQSNDIDLKESEGHNKPNQQITTEQLHKKYIKYKKKSEVQQAIILSLNQQMNDIKIKEGHVQQYDMNHVNQCINSEIIKFKQMYNEERLAKLCEENPTDFVNENSELNRNINSYKSDIAITMESLRSFDEYIEETKKSINTLSSPNESEYKYWNLNTMIMWIGSLENGRYNKYLHALRNGFKQSLIYKGEYLPDLDVATLSVEPFSINSFPDKRDLVRKFKELLANTEVEGCTIYH